jgi:Fe-S-cluster containining protein
MRETQADPNPCAPARVAPEHLRALYEELDRRLDALLSAHPGSSCRECGTCCTFPPGAPVLYATTLEHAYLASHPPPAQAGLPEGTCPYFEHDTSFCTARERRPVACRTHFCDESMAERAAREATQDLYEWAHAELRRISEAHGLEWDSAPVIDSLGTTNDVCRQG